MIAAILESGELERVSTGLSLLVSAAAEGGRRARWRPSARSRVLLDDELEARALRPGAAPHVPEAAVRCSRARSPSCATRRPRWTDVPHLGVRRGGRDDGRRPRRDRGAAGRRALDAALPARGRRGGARRRMSGAPPLLAALAVALALAGCGTPSPDLFEVKRSGEDRERERRRRRQRRRQRELQRQAATRSTADLLLRARQLAARPRAAGRAAPRAAAGPAAPSCATRCGWRPARSPSRTPRAATRRSFLALAAFTKDVTEDVCGLDAERLGGTVAPRGGALRRDPLGDDVRVRALVEADPALASARDEPGSPPC